MIQSVRRSCAGVPWVAPTVLLLMALTVYPMIYYVKGSFFFFSSRRRHTRWNCDWSSDVCSSHLLDAAGGTRPGAGRGARGHYRDRRAADGGAGTARPDVALPGRAQPLLLDPAPAAARARGRATARAQIGRASCRERV